MHLLMLVTRFTVHCVPWHVAVSPVHIVFPKCAVACMHGDTPSLPKQSSHPHLVQKEKHEIVVQLRAKSASQPPYSSVHSVTAPGSASHASLPPGAQPSTEHPLATHPSTLLSQASLPASIAASEKQPPPMQSRTSTDAKLDPFHLGAAPLIPKSESLPRSATQSPTPSSQRPSTLSTPHGPPPQPLTMTTDPLGLTSQRSISPASQAPCAMSLFPPVVVVTPTVVPAAAGANVITTGKPRSSSHANSLFPLITSNVPFDDSAYMQPSASADVPSQDLPASAEPRSVGEAVPELVDAQLATGMPGSIQIMASAPADTSVVGAVADDGQHIQPSAVAVSTADGLPGQQAVPGASTEDATQAGSSAAEAPTLSAKPPTVTTGKAPTAASLTSELFPSILNAARQPATSVPQFSPYINPSPSTSSGVPVSPWRRPSPDATVRPVAAKPGLPSAPGASAQGSSSIFLPVVPRSPASGGGNPSAAAAAAASEEHGSTILAHPFTASGGSLSAPPLHTSGAAAAKFEHQSLSTSLFPPIFSSLSTANSVKEGEGAPLSKKADLDGPKSPLDSSLSLPAGGLAASTSVETLTAEAPADAASPRPTLSFKRKRQPPAISGAGASGQDMAHPARGIQQIPPQMQTWGHRGTPSPTSPRSPAYGGADGAQRPGLQGSSPWNRGGRGARSRHGWFGQGGRRAGSEEGRGAPKGHKKRRVRHGKGWAQQLPDHRPLIGLPPPPPLPGQTHTCMHADGAPLGSKMGSGGSTEGLLLPPAQAHPHAHIDGNRLSGRLGSTGRSECLPLPPAQTHPRTHVDGSPLGGRQPSVGSFEGLQRPPGAPHGMPADIHTFQKGSRAAGESRWDAARPLSPRRAARSPPLPQLAASSGSGCSEPFSGAKRSLPPDIGHMPHRDRSQKLQLPPPPPKPPCGHAVCALQMCLMCIHCAAIHSS
jgi:hypothetical protein